MDGKSAVGYRATFMDMDVPKAHALRVSLSEAGVYPALELQGEVFERYEENVRAWLPDLLARLDRTDVAAVFRAVELLALVPRHDDLWQAVAG